MYAPENYELTHLQPHPLRGMKNHAPSFSFFQIVQSTSLFFHSSVEREIERKVLQAAFQVYAKGRVDRIFTLFQGNTW